MTTNRKTKTPKASKAEVTQAAVAQPSPLRTGGKVGAMAELLRRPEGAKIEELIAATGWQAHSVRGAISGSLRKRQGLTVTSEKSEAGRVYRIPAETQA